MHWHCHDLFNRMPRGAVAGGIAVVIDVLRASTTIVTALAHGATGVRPVLTVEVARALAAGHACPRIFKRGIAEVEAVDPQATTLATQEHAREHARVGASAKAGRQSPGHLDREHRPDAGGPVGQGRDDRRGGPQYVDHDRDPSRNRPLRHTMKQVVAVPMHRVFQE